MSRLDAVVPRSAVRLNTLARYDFGGDAKRVVRLAVLDTDDGPVARVFGVDGRTVVLLDEQRVESWQKRRSTTVTLVDGTVWEARAGGCGCGSPLRHIDVTKEYPRA